MSFWESLIKLITSIITLCVTVAGVLVLYLKCKAVEPSTPISSEISSAQSSRWRIWLDVSVLVGSLLARLALLVLLLLLPIEDPRWFIALVAVLLSLAIPSR